MAQDNTTVQGILSSIESIEKKMPMHEAVVKAVTENVNGVITRFETKIEGAGRTTGKYGYPDIMLFPYVWEVKPDSVYGHTTGPVQMERYTKDGVHLPGWALELVPIKYGNGYIYTQNGSAATNDPGIIYYEYRPNENGLSADAVGKVINYVVGLGMGYLADRFGTAFGLPPIPVY